MCRIDCILTDPTSYLSKPLSRDIRKEGEERGLMGNKQVHGGLKTVTSCAAAAVPAVASSVARFLFRMEA